MSKHVLIVDDEARIREVVQYALVKEGYRVSVAADGAKALEEIERSDVDLLVLDVMLPEIDGLEVCRKVRAKSQLPILFLSARGEEIDRVVGLELGGDDYLAKPFSTRELVARVRALLRRVDAQTTEPATREPSQLTCGPVQLDLDRHEARCHDQVISLTATEFGLLGALMERPGIVLTRAQLMQRAYRYDNLITERTIDTHVRRIRAKFRDAGGDPIGTVHGVGYKAAQDAGRRKRP